MSMHSFRESAFAQGNLAPNPSFEEMNFCPQTISGIPLPGGTTPVVDWYTVSQLGTTDYLNACAPSGVLGVSVPDNFRGFQYPHNGDGYIGAFLYTDKPIPVISDSSSFSYDTVYYREYAQAELNAPLTAGHRYQVNFWVSCAEKGPFIDDQTYYIDRIGAFFRTGHFVGQTPGPLSNFQPQVSSPTGNYLSDTLNWIEISGTFVASGGEDVIIIGNFTPQSQISPKVLPGKRIFSGDTVAHAYYYIDDVCVLDLSAASSAQVHEITICDSSTRQLSGRADLDNYVWNTGDSVISIEISEPGTYWVRSIADCQHLVDTYHVRNAQFPLLRDTVSCHGQPVDLQLPRITGMTYEWEDGSTENYFTAEHSGTYGVTLTKDGCTESQTAKVIIQDFSQNLGEDTSVICARVNPEIYLTANVPSGAVVDWSTGSHTPSLIVDEPGTYWVQVRKTIHIDSNAFVCSDTDTIKIDYEACDCKVNVANAFSPNGDGLNDIFLPVMGSECFTNNYLLRIYNRYGQAVFSSFNPKVGWDGGTPEGRPADLGVYFYVIKFSDKSGKAYFMKGDLTLLK